MDHLYFEPLAVAVWTAIIIVSFLLVLTRVLGSMRALRAYRRELILRAQSLRIHKMLTRAGTSLSRYLRRARPTEVERHLLACQNCQTTDRCDKYLDKDEDIDPRSFCPNFVELATHGRGCKREHLAP